MGGYSDDCYAQIRIIVMLYNSRLEKSDLSEPKRREVAAVSNALQWIKDKYGPAAYQFLMYYCIDKKYKKLDNAADAVFYSARNCRKIKRKFYQHIAEELGYI